jgi:hypothetical protein
MLKWGLREPRTLQYKIYFKQWTQSNGMSELTDTTNQLLTLWFWDTLYSVTSVVLRILVYVACNTFTLTYITHNVIQSGPRDTADLTQVKYYTVLTYSDRLCGLVVRVLGYRSGGPGSIPDTTRKKK